MDEIMDDTHVDVENLDDAGTDNDNEDVTEQNVESNTNNDVGGGIVTNKRSFCWKHFTVIKKGPKPRASCNWCGTDYACHSKNNGTKSMTHHLIYQCTKYPSSKKFTGSRQKILSFEKHKSEDGETSSHLVSMTFSAKACERALAEMLIRDELPFSFVEGGGFLHFMHVAQPKWTKIPCRITIAKHCMLIYREEKKALHRVLKTQRLCLTTDTWTSIQNLNYMCLTGHFIDDEWKYQKRILNFCVVPNHKGETLGKVTENCLVDWGIDKILTVTVDNAASNNLLIDYLKSHTQGRKTTIMGHKFIHVRCCAHILNLIVREGLLEIEESIVRVRNVVKYVRSSPSRMAEFWSWVEKEGIECKLKPCLDVATRWNYTYFMLDRALIYRNAFQRLCNEALFKLSLNEAEFDAKIDEIDVCDSDTENSSGLVVVEEIGRGNGKGKRQEKGKGKGKGKGNIGPPTCDDWEKIKLYVEFLKMFYHATLRFSGSLYVTSNDFFHEMISIQAEIKKLSANEDLVLYGLASGMSAKFDKYWGKFDKINQLLLFAVVLDPRYKINFVEYCFQKALSYDVGLVNQLISKLNEGLTGLFEWYVNDNKYGSFQEVGGSSKQGGLNRNDENDCRQSLKSEYETYIAMKSDMASKSELEKYLLDPREEGRENFDILGWWKINSSKYPILSQVARDVLAVPVSTVASESAFSTGGRVLDPYRSSLAPKTVEALICTQQWIRKPTPINLREQLDELQHMDSSNSFI